MLRNVASNPTIAGTRQDRTGNAAGTAHIDPLSGERVKSRDLSPTVSTGAAGY